MEGPESNLIERARDGDKEALTSLIQETSPGIYRFALRMTRSEEDARDLTQETFVRMLRNLDRYDASYSINTWLYRIVRNLCIDRSRRLQRWRPLFRREREESEGDPMMEHPDEQASQLDELLDREKRHAVEGAVKHLKPKYREVLLLFHFEELSYQDIADVLQVPIGTVMNRIFRARRQLRDHLGEALVPT